MLSFRGLSPKFNSLLSEGVLGVRRVLKMFNRKFAKTLIMDNSFLFKRCEKVMVRKGSIKYLHKAKDLEGKKVFVYWEEVKK